MLLPPQPTIITSPSFLTVPPNLPPEPSPNSLAHRYRPTPLPSPVPSILAASPAFPPVSLSSPPAGRTGTSDWNRPSSPSLQQRRPSMPDRPPPRFRSSPSSSSSVSSSSDWPGMETNASFVSTSSSFSSGGVLPFASARSPAINLPGRGEGEDREAADQDEVGSGAVTDRSPRAAAVAGSGNNDDKLGGPGGDQAARTSTVSSVTTTSAATASPPRVVTRAERTYSNKMADHVLGLLKGIVASVLNDPSSPKVTRLISRSLLSLYQHQEDRRWSGKGHLDHRQAEGLMARSECDMR